MSTLKKCGRCIKNIDVFALDVNFKYSRKHKFKTALGGMVTLAATIGILAFLLVMIRQILRKEKSQIVNSMQKRGDLSFNEDTLINLTRNNFDIALSIMYIGPQDGVAENLDEYFSFYIQQVYTELITDKN